MNKSATPKDSITAGAVGLCSSTDVDANITMCERLVQDAATRGADWVVLPEMWPSMGDSKRLPKVAQRYHEICEHMAGWAKTYGVVLFAGSVPEPCPPSAVPVERVPRDLVFNTCHVYGRDGRCLATYRKVHLFSLFGPDGRTLRSEHESFAGGNQLVTCDVDGWHVGLAICFDLRFPWMFSHLAKVRPLDAVVVPAAFTRETGRDHWELLIRARAIDSQVFVIAPNQVGDHTAGVASFGHSMIVDPWGKVLANLGNSPHGVASAVLDRGLVESTRRRLPLRFSERQDIAATT